MKIIPDLSATNAARRGKSGSRAARLRMPLAVLIAAFAIATVFSCAPAASENLDPDKCVSRIEKIVLEAGK